MFNIEAQRHALRNLDSLSLFSNIKVHPLPDEKKVGGIAVGIKLKEDKQTKAIGFAKLPVSWHEFLPTLAGKVFMCLPDSFVINNNQENQLLQYGNQKPSQTSRGVLVGPKMGFKPQKEYPPVIKKPNASSSDVIVQEIFTQLHRLPLRDTNALGIPVKTSRSLKFDNMFAFIWNDPRGASFDSSKRVSSIVRGTFRLWAHFMILYIQNGILLSLGPVSAGMLNYKGVANVVAETAWIRTLLRELHTPLLSATLVYCVNRQALRNLDSLSLFSNIEVHPLPDEKQEGGIAVGIKLKEDKQTKTGGFAKLPVAWHGFLPTLDSILPGGNVSFICRNIEGLNISIIVSVVTMSMLNPQFGHEEQSIF
ncbi:protein TOC75-3, chloroplastic [Tanacetum coccineum]